MKKKKNKPKLSLNKQTMARLNDSELKAIIGGGFTENSTCLVCSGACTQTVRTYTCPNYC